MQIQFLTRFNNWLVGWFLVLALLQTPFTVWLSSLWPEYRLVFRALSEIVLAVIVLLTAVVFLNNQKRVEFWRSLSGFGRWLLIITGVYVLFNLLVALVLGGDLQSVFAGLLFNLRFLVWMIVVFVLVRSQPKLSAIIKRRFWLVSLVVIIFGFLQITVLPRDFLANFGYSEQTIQPFLTIDQNSNLFRINSTLRGPNMLGAFCVIFISFCLQKLLKTRQRHYLIWLFMGLAVLIFTWSRSAWLATAVASGIILWGNLAQEIFQKIARAGLTLAVVGMIIASFIITQLPGGGFAKMFNQVVLHHNPDSSTISKSNNEHTDSLQLAIDSIAKRPFGHGIGTTGSASLYSGSNRIVENYFLAVGVEMGVIGLLIFVVLFCGVIWRLKYWAQDKYSLTLLASGVGLGLICLVLPLWSDGAVSYSWWGLVGLFLAKKEI